MPANLIAYSRTCQKNYEPVSSFYQRAFRIKNTLHKYFTMKETLRFQELQELTGDKKTLFMIAYHLINHRDDHLGINHLGIF